MQILGIRDARYINASNTLVDLILETDEGDVPFTYDPADTSPATEHVRVNFRTLAIAEYTPPSLSEIKAEKLAEIAGSRWGDEVAPYFYEPKNAYFDTSERSQIKYLQALRKGISTMWKTVDGWVEMTPADFAGLIASYEAFVAGLFAAEAITAKAIGECATKEELNSIIWNGVAKG